MHAFTTLLSNVIQVWYQFSSVSKLFQSGIAKNSGVAKLRAEQ